MSIAHVPRLRWARARSTVAVVALGCWVLSLGCSDANEAARPDPDRLNVVIITLDTTRADALGIYGQERATSPNLDAYATRGVVFDQAATTQSSTLPSHSTIMTGRLPFAHGARANAGYVLAEDNTTLAEVFQENGYVTGAEIAAPVIGSRTLLDQGFATYRDLDAFDVQRKKITVSELEGPREMELAERDGADITRRGLEFLRRNKTEPFFLWLHYFDPHAFYAAPAPYGDDFRKDPYYGEIFYTDYNVGRIISELDSLGLDEKTLVVITADHGESLGEHGELSHSFFIYEATIHVPLIMVAPGEFAGGRRVRAPVRTADIAPTVLELAGLPPIPKIQGVSLAGVVRGESEVPPLDLYGESFESLSTFGTNALRFLRRGSWKYVHKLRPELFDLSADPDELTNIIESHPAQAEKMKRDLKDWVRGALIARDGNRIQLDEEAIAQLNALGYIGEGAPSGFDEILDMENLHAPDPVDRVADTLLYATGWGKIKASKFDEANETFRHLLSRNPDSLPILRASLASTRDDDVKVQAERRLPVVDRLIALETENPHHLVMRSDLLAALGREPQEIEDALRGALLVEHCNVPARIVLANMLNGYERYAEQRDVLTEAIEDCDAEINSRNDLAYLLATAPDDSVRDGARAVELAKLVVAESPDERPDFLDTLACAWAEAGNFEQAKVHAKRAIELISRVKLPESVVEPYHEHLALFEKGEAAREGGTPRFSGD